MHRMTSESHSGSERSHGHGLGDKAGYLLDGRFKLIQGLGDPETTKVYLARDLHTSSTVVIKYGDASMEREYDILQALSHERIIPCHQHTSEAPFWQQEGSNDGSLDWSFGPEITQLEVPKSTVLKMRTLRSLFAKLKETPLEHSLSLQLFISEVVSNHARKVSSELAEIGEQLEIQVSDACSLFQNPCLSERWALPMKKKPPPPKTVEKIVAYMTFDYYSKGDLLENIHLNGSFPEIAARFYFHQLASCIEFIHSCGFVHWDIKLENVVLDDDYNLKLIDFGLAEPIESRRDPSTKCLMTGTSGYIAPEQMSQHDGICLKKCDIFSMGVFLFVMLWGYMPFEEPSPENKLYQCIASKRYSQFWKMHQERRGGNGGVLSWEVRNLICDMLSPNPDERPTLS